MNPINVYKIEITETPVETYAKIHFPDNQVIEDKSFTLRTLLDFLWIDIKKWKKEKAR